MVEFGTLTATAGEKLHTKGGEIDYSNFHFPTTLGEIEDLIRSVDPVQRAFELGLIVTDAERAYFKSDALDAKMKKRRFWEKQERVEHRTSLVFVSGLMTWKGSDLVRTLAPSWVPKLLIGTYDLALKYWQDVGFDVRPVWPESGIQTGNLKETVAKIDQEVTLGLEYGDVVAVGHSFGGEALKYWASKYPDKAKKLGGIYLGGSPLPFQVNSIVAQGLLVMQGDKTPVGALNELKDFEGSGDARMIHFVSMIAEDDYILAGPSCGETIYNTDGHASMFYDDDILSLPARRINSNRCQSLQSSDYVPVSSSIYRSTLPLVVVH